MSQKINSLQLLRAVAVSLVIFTHANHYIVPNVASSSPVDSFYHLKTFGPIGVDLFFAISGFIMTIIYPAYHKPGGWKTFFMKRIIRIIPLYYLLSCVDAFVTFYLHHQPVEWLVVIKTIIFFPIFDSPVFLGPLISVGWSLSYEIYFYALIGLALLIKKNVIEKLLGILVVLSTIGIFWNPDNTLLRFLTSPMLLEFGFGMLCGMLYSRFNQSNIEISKKQVISITLTFVGAALMISTIFFDLSFDIYNQNVIANNNVAALYKTIIWGLPSAMFLLGVILMEKSFSLNVAAALILVGDASYSAYLTHGMVYPVVAKISQKLSIAPIPYLIVAVPVCVIASIVFYKLVEKPLVVGVDKLLKYKRPVIMK